MKATKTFLAKGSNIGKATGTPFIIEDGWGYDIQPYSLFPEEAEILLEPEMQFKVLSVIPSRSHCNQSPNAGHTSCTATGVW